MVSFRKLISLLLVAAMLFSLSCEAFAANAGDEEGGFEDDPAPAGSGSVLTLPAALEVIEEEAFYGDDSLEEVVIPYGATTIGPRAFAYSGLKRITIPDTVTEIAGDAFEGTDGLTIFAPASSYAYEFAVEHELSRENDTSSFINEKLSGYTPVIDKICDLGSIMPEETDYTPESTKGVTDPELLKILKSYNTLMLELEEKDNANRAMLGEVLGAFDTMTDEMLEAGYHLGEDGRMIEIPGFSFDVPASVSDLFSDDYEIVGTTTLDDGSSRIEIISEGKTYYVEMTDGGMTLSEPGGQQIVALLSSDTSAFLAPEMSFQSMVDRVNVACTDIQRWIDTTLEIIQDKLGLFEANEQSAVKRLEDEVFETEVFIWEKSTNPENAAQVNRARQVQAKLNLRLSQRKAVLTNIRKFIGVLTGIGVAWDAAQVRSSLDKVNLILKIEKHGHPTAADLSDPQKAEIAAKLPTWLLNARRAYLLDAANGALTFMTDMASLIANIALVIPGAQAYFIGAKLGALAARASIDAICKLLFLCGFVTSTAADEMMYDIENGEDLLHNSISGTVTDKNTGIPLEGVSILLAGMNGQMTVHTGKDGRYIFRKLTPGRYVLAFTKEGYDDISAEVILTATETPGPCDQAMEGTTSTVSGTVTADHTNARLKGVSVTLDGSQTTTTDASGKYSFLNVTLGEHHLSFSVAGYKSIAETITVTKEEIPFDFALQEDESSLSGVVTDSKTGKALSGVKVTLTTPLDGSFVTYTDASGTYSFTNVPYDTHGIKFEKAGYETKTGKVTMALIGNTKRDVRMVPQADDKPISSDDFDPKFWAWCVKHYDQNQDSTLSREEILAVTEIGIYDEGFSSLNGIRNFSNLTWLDCGRNQLTSLDLSGCSALTTLVCWYNQLTSLNLSGCSALKTLSCDDNHLTSLNLSGCSALTMLYCDDNHLTSLNLSGCSALTTLECWWNKLTSLNLSGCSALKTLSCADNQLTSLNLSGCSALTELICTWNQLTSLNLSGCSALIVLSCWNNQLTSLNLSGCSALTHLNCDNNQLTSLNLSSCPKLTDDNITCDSGVTIIR